MNDLNETTAPAPGDESSRRQDGEPRPRKLRLDQFLKFMQLAGTGGEAKFRIQSGEVTVNGEVETRRGRGLRPGDRIELDGEVRIVEQELWDRASD